MELAVPLHASGPSFEALADTLEWTRRVNPRRKSSRSNEGRKHGQYGGTKEEEAEASKKTNKKTKNKRKKT